MANRPNYKKRAQRAFEEDFLAQTIEDEEFIISVTSKAHVVALRYITRQIEECINDRKTQERLKQTVSEAVQSALRTFVSEELREVRVRAVERIETAAENMIKNIKAQAARSQAENPTEHLLKPSARLDQLEGKVRELERRPQTVGTAEPSGSAAEIHYHGCHFGGQLSADVAHLHGCSVSGMIVTSNLK